MPMSDKKILVIGTSNSVMKNSYVLALSEFFQVNNVSLGRTPIFHHIVAYLENEIDSYDVIILDFYVNSLYYDLPNYMVHVENLLEVLAASGKVIINIFFPVMNMSENHLKYYGQSLSLTKKKKIYYIDFNEIHQLKPSYFKDKIHLKSQVSYLFGVFFRNYLKGVSFPDIQKGKVCSLPYKLVTPEAPLPLYEFTNSLVSIKYITLERGISLAVDKSKLLALSYLGRKEASGINIFNEKMELLGSRSFLSGGYFVEAIDLEVESDSNIFVSPIDGEQSIPSLMNRDGNIKGAYSPPNIVSFLFYNGEQAEVVPSSLDGGKIILDEFITSLKYLGGFQEIDEDEINNIRDSAIALEDIEPQLALCNYQIARKFRPDGKLINSRIKRLLNDNTHKLR